MLLVANTVQKMMTKSSHDERLEKQPVMKSRCGDNKHAAFTGFSHRFEGVLWLQC